MWTQEWSDIPSRSEATWAMCHQVAQLGVRVDPLEERLELRRLPRVGRPDARLGDRRRGHRDAPLARAAPARRVVRRVSSTRSRRRCSVVATGASRTRHVARGYEPRRLPWAMGGLARSDRAPSDDVGAVVTLQPPREAQRALDRAAARSSPRRSQALSDDRGVGCVVLTGAGPAFCSGMDTTPVRRRPRAPRARSSRRARSPSRRWATAGARSSRPSTARRSPAASRWRCCATCESPRPRPCSAIRSSRAGSRRATRRRARCCRRRSPRSSASPAAWSRPTRRRGWGSSARSPRATWSPADSSSRERIAEPAAQGGPRDQAPHPARAPPPVGLPVRGRAARSSGARCSARRRARAGRRGRLGSGLGH